MSEDIKEILDKAKEISDYGADGKQHTRMFNQFEAKALLDYITNLQDEYERLNNIIDELERHIKRVTYYDIYGEQIIDSILNKLQELKGSDKE